MIKISFTSLFYQIRKFYDNIFFMLKYAISSLIYANASYLNVYVYVIIYFLIC